MNERSRSAVFRSSAPQPRGRPGMPYLGIIRTSVPGLPKRPLPSCGQPRPIRSIPRSCSCSSAACDEVKCWDKLQRQRGWEPSSAGGLVSCSRPLRPSAQRRDCVSAATIGARVSWPGSAPGPGVLEKPIGTLAPGGVGNPAEQHHGAGGRVIGHRSLPRGPRAGRGVVLGPLRAVPGPGGIE
jgi:hypothetical protein